MLLLHVGDADIQMMIFKWWTFIETSMDNSNMNADALLKKNFNA